MMKYMRLLITGMFILHMSLCTMEPVEHHTQPFSKLPQELNWEILVSFIENADYANIGKTLTSLAVTSKKNNTFINNPETTEKLINLINQRAKNKARAAEILKTNGAKQWLDTYRKTAEGKKAFEQAREDEQEFLRLVNSYNPSLSAIKNYITMGINVNIVDSLGYTALMSAVEFGNTEIVKLLLLTTGINVNTADNNGKTALMNAFLRKETEIIKLLMSAPGINVNAVDRVEGWSILMLAVASGDTEIVERLLKIPDINVNVVNKSGKTALDLAIQLNPEMIDILKAHGAKSGKEPKGKAEPQEPKWKNYYEILGLSPKATETEIRKAYKALAFKYHPDRNPGNKEAEEKFKAILHAYEMLMKHR